MQPPTTIAKTTTSPHELENPLLKTKNHQSLKKTIIDSQRKITFLACSTYYSVYLKKKRRENSKNMQNHHCTHESVQNRHMQNKTRLTRSKQKKKEVRKKEIRTLSGHGF
jgi:hypothetical protein